MFSSTVGRSRPYARLKKRDWIRPLFDRHRPDVGSTAAGCVRLLHRIVQVEAQASRIFVGFTANSALGSAVKRNRVKRQLREGFAKHADVVLQGLQHSAGTLTLMVLYRHRNLHASEVVHRDLRTALQQLPFVDTRSTDGD